MLLSINRDWTATPSAISENLNSFSTFCSSVFSRFSRFWNFFSRFSPFRFRSPSLHREHSSGSTHKPIFLWCIIFWPAVSLRTALQVVQVTLLSLCSLIHVLHDGQLLGGDKWLSKNHSLA